MACFETFWGHLGSCWVFLVILGVLGRLGDVSGGPEDILWLVLAGLWPLLEIVGDLLGPPWASFGGLWGVLGGSLGPLWAKLHL